MPSKFKPFADESTCITVEDLTLENRLDRVSIYGSVDITLDKEGLVKAQALMALLQPVLDHLQNAKLPDKVVLVEPTIVKNQFQ
jgi:hypothetical protein